MVSTKVKYNYREVERDIKWNFNVLLFILTLKKNAFTYKISVTFKKKKKRVIMFTGYFCVSAD